MDGEGAPAVAPGIALNVGIPGRAPRGLARSLGLWDTIRSAFAEIDERGRNKGAGALPALEVSLDMKLRVGDENREARDLQLGGERTAGWHLLPWTEFSAQDGIAKPDINLMVQRGFEIPADTNDRKDSGGNCGHESPLLAARSERSRSFECRFRTASLGCIPLRAITHSEGG